MTATAPASAPGVLLFDPSPTTSRLAAAGLRMAGFAVTLAESEDAAVAECRKRGPGGTREIAALVLDASVQPARAAGILRAVAQLPGADTLAGVLLVSRGDTNPIPGAEGLPVLRRPFATPALVRVLKEALELQAPLRRAERGGDVLVVNLLRELLAQHGSGASLTDEVLQKVASALALSGLVPGVGHSFAADLAGQRLESILDLLATDGRTGVLEGRSGDAIARLHLEQGLIRLGEAVSTQEDLRLGRFIVEAGLLAAEELEAFVEQQPGEGLLGARLVQSGLLAGADLGRVLVLQARETACHMLTWERGTVSFTPTTELDERAAAARAARVELTIAEAVLDGLRRVEERAAMGPHMPQPEEVFLRVDEQIAKVGRHNLSRDELAILELVNGRNTVKEIARKTRAGNFAVARTLHRLNRAGVVRRAAQPAVV